MLVILYVINSFSVFKKKIVQVKFQSEVFLFVSYTIGNSVFR